MIEYKPTFINTRNVRNFTVLMDGIGLGTGEGRLGLVVGRAGRGKTRTSQWYTAHSNAVYLRIATIWRSSELELLRALCKELGIRNTPHRKGPAFNEAVDALVNRPRPVFLDEIEKMPKFFLDLVRDLTDLTTSPFVLIGEEEILPYVRQNRRVWSRVYQSLEFEQIGVADAILFAKQAANMAIDQEIAGILYTDSQGDFRLLKRNLLVLIQIANSQNGNGSGKITPDMAKLAGKTGLIGR